MEQGEFRHARHTALLLISRIRSTGAAKPNAEYTICETATKTMRNRDVQALDLSQGFSDFGKLAWCVPRSGWLRGRRVLWGGKYW